MCVGGRYTEFSLCLLLLQSTFQAKRDSIYVKCIGFEARLKCVFRLCYLNPV